MEQSELFSRLGVALAIGLLVGLERGWSQREAEDRSRAAGFRTFALSGLLGGVAGLISLHTDALLPTAVFLAYASCFALFHWLEARTDHDVSVTSVIAGLITYLLGFLAVLGDLEIAIACAVAMTALLALRDPLHRWVATLTWPEIRSVLTILAMTFLLLPLLPNRTIDPWQAINPYEIWLLTVVIAAVSFAGYAAVKALGDRKGLLVAAIAGGLASSTATTLALSKIGRQRPASASLASAGILLAGLVMMMRVVSVIAVLNLPLVERVIWPLGAAAAVFVLSAWLLARGADASEETVSPIANPLELGTAFKLGGVMVVVLLATAYLHAVFGTAGALISGAILGLGDVDAVTISMARMARTGLAPDIAAQAILAGVGANTLVKAALAAWAGNRQIGLAVGVTSILAVGAAFAAWSLGIGT